MALPQLFSIGEMAKIFHLSVSSLRHYEALGLVSPEYVDPSTNYRYYSVRQFEPLNTIRYLRAMDMPLTEIADFLQNRDVETDKQSDVTYILEFTTEDGQTQSFETLHYEVAPISLLSVDAAAGATPIAFTAPEK